MYRDRCIKLDLRDTEVMLKITNVVLYGRPGSQYVTIFHRVNKPSWYSQQAYCIINEMSTLVLLSRLETRRHD